MRISFDIDDTLRMHGEGYEHDPDRIPLILRFLFRERFRKGTYELMSNINDSGHEICVYTTSSRSASYIKWWFYFYGVRLHLIVNGQEHARIVKQQGMERAPSKNPAKFGIDLHIDDLPGVAVEGERFGFDVLVLDTEDQQWADKVTNAINISEQGADS